ncbi:MAG TPA: hypothetical protein ENK18_13230 [Deltaproteobacteria bacterium]|nr:hypothetical protein [Deltaproteobacteria bacterium]
MRWLPLSCLLLLSTLTSPASAQDPDGDVHTQLQAKKPSRDRAGGGGGGGNSAAKGKKKKKKKKGPKYKGPFKKKEYPFKELMRPLTLPEGMGEGGLELGYQRLLQTDFVTSNLTFDYGVTDEVELGASLGLYFVPDVGASALTLRGHYLAYDSRLFDAAPGVLFPVGLQEGFPIQLIFESPCRYLLTDELYLYFGQGAVPITLSPGFAMAISANGGVGYQLNKEVAFFADTQLLSLVLAPEAGVTGPWQTLVLNGGAQYTPIRELDVGGRLNVSTAWEAIDLSLNLSLNGYVRYRF